MRGKEVDAGLRHTEDAEIRESAVKDLKNKCEEVCQKKHKMTEKFHEEKIPMASEISAVLSSFFVVLCCLWQNSLSSTHLLSGQ
jgi:hypothetical protein